MLFSESSGSGWVFGIPLAKVNAKDLELRRRKPSSLRERRDSLDLAQPHLHTRWVTSASLGSHRDAGAWDGDGDGGGVGVRCLGLTTVVTR